MERSFDEKHDKSASDRQIASLFEPWPDSLELGFSSTQSAGSIQAHPELPLSVATTSPLSHGNPSVDSDNLVPPTNLELNRRPPDRQPPATAIGQAMPSGFGRAIDPTQQAPSPSQHPTFQSLSTKLIADGRVATEGATSAPTPPQPTLERPTSERPTSERPTSERPTSEKPTHEQITREQPTREQVFGLQPMRRQSEESDRRDGDRRSTIRGRRIPDLRAERDTRNYGLIGVVLAAASVVLALYAFRFAPLSYSVSPDCPASEGFNGQVEVHRGLSLYWSGVMALCALSIVIPTNKRRPRFAIILCSLSFGLLLGALLRVETFTSGLCFS
jgi:hypothetical protein